MRFVVLPGTRSAGLFSRRPAGTESGTESWTECGGLRSPLPHEFGAREVIAVRLIFPLVTQMAQGFV